mgnify:CR=1 FL=1
MQENIVNACVHAFIHAYKHNYVHAYANTHTRMHTHTHINIILNRYGTKLRTFMFAKSPFLMFSASLFPTSSSSPSPHVHHKHFIYHQSSDNTSIRPSN